MRAHPISDCSNFFQIRGPYFHQIEKSVLILIFILFIFDS